MMPNKVPQTYLNKKGETCEVGTNRVLRLNKDGSLNMTQFNHAITKFNNPKTGLALDKANVAKAKLSPYTGEQSEKNWKKYFAFLKEYPLALSKAAVIAGFTRLGVAGYLSKNESLKERYDDIMESELDNLEENIRDIAYEPDPKYISTKLKANTELLGARAKDRGYGHKGGFSIESGRDTNIVIVNNTGVSLPGQKTEDADFKEVK